MGGIEAIAGKNIADHMLQAPFLGQFGRGGKQLPIRDGGIGAGQLELRHVIAVGAGAFGYDNIAEMQVGVQRAGAAKADNVLYIVEMEQLIAVNADGGMPMPCPIMEMGLPW